MTIKQWLLSTLVGSTCLISIAAVAGPIENYSPVTADRLNNPEPGNWMLYRRTYDGQGYSPLDQINTSNVKNLTPVWTFSTGVNEGHEAPPIVNNGVMFVAFDANDGKELWRTFTIPGDAEPGHDTWSGDDWKTGGAPAWMTGTYDKDTRTIYWGTGNAAPWPGANHPGDNLYTSSVLALDPENGKIKAFHQYHQNDSWDWDEVDAPMLVDLQRDGRSFKSLIHPGRDAIFWVLERKADRINYVASWPFVYTDVWKGIEAETGRPIVDPDHKPTLGKRVEFCPSLWGGKDWPSAAYSQRTGLVYVPANENFCGGFTGEKVPLVPGQLWLGTKPEDIGLSVVPGADHYGELQAWDPATGKKVWSHNFAKSQMFGSVTATAGDLVFAGGANDRVFRAFNAKTGEVLWEQKTNSGIRGMPMAYEVDGTEYIAIQSGWGVDAQRIQDALVGNHIGLENNVPQGGVVWVFAVKK